MALPLATGPRCAGEVMIPRSEEGGSGHLEALELELLLWGVWRRYGYDFRQYTRPTLLRRVRTMMQSEGATTMTALLERLLREPELMARFVAGVSIHASQMFRDPEFFLALRTLAMPILRTYPFLRIWHAGCATGEEVYSLSILLHEEGLHERCRIYATDISQQVLERARRGAFPIGTMQGHTENYLGSGGKKAFSCYYTADAEHAVFHPWLRRNVVFAQHNLVCDGIFNEFHLILCRNVMLYFNASLRERVHELLRASSVRFGLLGIGQKETLNHSSSECSYTELSPGTRLYRRKK